MAVLRMGSAPPYSVTQKEPVFTVSILFGWFVARLTTECASDSGVGSGMDSWVYGGIDCGMDSRVYSGWVLGSNHHSTPITKRTG